jgi:hypothetical protein
MDSKKLTGYIQTSGRQQTLPARVSETLGVSREQQPTDVAMPEMGAAVKQMCVR